MTASESLTNLAAIMFYGWRIVSVVFLTHITLWGATIGAGFGRVMGLMTPVMVPIHIFGIPYSGLIYDRTGNYQIAFITFLGAYALAMTATLFLRLPEAEPVLMPGAA